MQSHVISGLAMTMLAAGPAMTASDQAPAAAVPAQYPSATRGPVVEEHHGTKVADPYRWMETPGPELSAWVAAQNALSQPYLHAIPAREPLRERLTALAILQIKS